MGQHLTPIQVRWSTKLWVVVKVHRVCAKNVQLFHTFAASWLYESMCAVGVCCMLIKIQRARNLPVLFQCKISACGYSHTCFAPAIFALSKEAFCIWNHAYTSYQFSECVEHMLNF